MRKRKQSSRDDLIKEYTLLAMRADKRLQRLEKYMMRPGYSGIGKWAYARAMRDIEVWSGKGHKRFKTKAPATDEGLQAKINDIKAFLRADTSTMMPGIDTKGFAISVFQKQAETFNERYGGNLTWQEIANYYGSKKAQRIASKIKASKTVAQALGEFKRLYEKDPEITGEKLMEAIKKNPNVKLSDKKAVDEIMKKMIKMGISPEMMFKGNS